LLSHHHVINQCRHLWVIADLLDQLRAEVGPVHGGDTDSAATSLQAVSGYLGVPGGRDQVSVYLARHHIKPIPTTILEWHQGQVKGEGLGIGPLHLASINSLRATIGH
jgi:hypothetical protein